MRKDIADRLDYVQSDINKISHMLGSSKLRGSYPGICEILLSINKNIETLSYTIRDIARDEHK